MGLTKKQQADYEQPTNADRIRAMSDEKLAELLCCMDWRLTEYKECLYWLQKPEEEAQDDA